MIEINKIYNENCLDTMSRMENNFVDLTVTSPPYDNLRTYNNNIDKTWGEHVWKPIIKELYRITKNGGVVVWVVGDATINFSETLTSFKQAIFAKEIGFNVLDTMIYFKQNYVPSYPSLRRYANQFEYMFVFSKGKNSTFNPIKIEKKEPKNGKCGFRQKNGDVIRKIIDIKTNKKDASNVWSYPVGFKNLGHPAVFPERLAQDHIASWSDEGDLVYDPFMGSGTTAKMAYLLKRNFIGSEISEEYCRIANERIKQEQQQLSLF